jgi:hypothetical protein
MTTATDSLLGAITEDVVKSFTTADESDYPFQHWQVENMLPKALTDQILAVRIPKSQGFLYDGTRASDSKLTPGGTPPQRMFITKEIGEEYPFFQDLVDAFLQPKVLDLVNNKFGVDTKDLYLRVEYINDFDGFFLEPHKDIIEKQFTLLLFQGEGPDYMGTDFYDTDLKVVKTVKFGHNRGYVFTPSENSWHGLEKKPIPDRRCSLLINYVTFKTDWPVSGA